MNCVPYICVLLLKKFLQGALRILAQVLERSDLGTRVFILMLLKLQATGRNCGGAKAFNSIYCACNFQRKKILAHRRQVRLKVEIWYVNWKNQVAI